jgi:hypothetical protein
MKPFAEEENSTDVSYTQEELRTSYNNMFCTVVYEPMTTEEQEEVNVILQVAN